MKKRSAGLAYREASAGLRVSFLQIACSIQQLPCETSTLLGSGRCCSAALNEWLRQIQASDLGLKLLVAVCASEPSVYPRNVTQLKLRSCKLETGRCLRGHETIVIPLPCVRALSPWLPTDSRPGNKVSESSSLSKVFWRVVACFDCLGIHGCALRRRLHPGVDLAQ